MGRASRQALNASVAAAIACRIAVSGSAAGGTELVVSPLEVGSPVDEEAGPDVAVTVELVAAIVEVCSVVGLKGTEDVGVGTDRTDVGSAVSSSELHAPKKRMRAAIATARALRIVPGSPTI